VAEKNLYAGFKPGDFKRARKELARSGENFFCSYCGKYVKGKKEFTFHSNDFFVLSCPLCGQFEKDNAGNIRWRCLYPPIAKVTGAKKRLIFL